MLILLFLRLFPINFFHLQLHFRHLIGWPGINLARWDGVCAGQLGVDPNVHQSRLDVNSGMIGRSTSGSVHENSSQLIVAVQATSYVSGASRLGNSSGGGSHSSAHHTLMSSIRIGHCVSIASHPVHDRCTDDAFLRNQDGGGLRRRQGKLIPFL